MNAADDDGAFFHALADYVPTMVFTAAADGTVEYFNSRWYAYTGQTPDQARDSGYRQVIHPDDSARLARSWSDIRAAGTGATLEGRYRRADGAYRWHRIAVAPYLDERGRIARWIGTITDIDAERSAERSFRALAETVPILVWAARPDGRLDYFNICWQQLVGDREALALVGWQGILHRDDGPAADEAWAESVRTGTEFHSRSRIRMRSGEYRWHDTTGVAERDDAGAIVRWYGVSTDIHESVVLRETLADQDTTTKLLRELASRTPSLLFSTTPDGRIEFVNERWSEVTGVDAAALVGFGWTRFVHVDDLDEVRINFQRHFQTGEPYAGEWRFKRSDNAYRWVEVRAEAQRDRDGRIVRWYGTGVDVDRRRRAIEALDLIAYSGIGAASAADSDSLLERVARASLAGVADVSVFDLLPPDGGTRRVVIAADDIAPELADMMRGYGTPAVDSPHPIARAIREKHTVLIPRVADAQLDALLDDAGRRDAWVRSGMMSMVTAPLLVEGSVRGAITLLRMRSDVPYDRQDVRVVEEIASRVAVALENFRLRELARTELAAREERFREMAQAIPQLMWVADSRGHVEWVNDRWLAFTGQTFVEAQAEGWRNIIHPDDEALAQDRWRAAEAAGTPYECEFRLRDTDGVYHWHLGRATPVATALGRRWYGTNTDIDEARRAARTLRIFADVGEALSESLGLQATLDAVMQVVVPEFADWAFITLADESADLYIAAIYHDDPEKSRVLSRLVGRLYARGHLMVGSPVAVRNREPLLYEAATYEDSARVVEADVVEAFWHVIGYSSVLVIPLVVGPAVRGTLTVLMAQSKRAFTPADVPFFTELGRRIAPAIANAEVFERERKVAQSFQRAALPATLPSAEGFVFSAIYEAGRAEALVGGDWYDAFTLLDGRIVVSVGDVAGSGLRAAVTMANIRQAIRGVAHVHADPELMLEAADRALRSDDPESFATAFVGVIDRVDGTLTYKSAGHLQALLQTANGSVGELLGGGLPLGVRDRDTEPAFVTLIEPDSTFVLYTDGLVETTHDIIAAERQLRDAIRRTAGSDPHARASAIYADMLPDGSRDDVAILSITVVPRAAPLRWTIDALDRASTSRARAEILEYLPLPPDAPERVAVELIIAELVGNLARYAPGPTEIVIERNGAQTVMHVRDNGPGYEFLPKLPRDIFSESGRGLFLISSLAADFNVTRRPEGGSHARIVFAL